MLDTASIWQGNYWKKERIMQDEYGEGGEFWDGYETPELPPFIEESVKKEMLESAEDFNIFNIRAGNTAEFGARWYVDIERDDGERGTFGFKKQHGPRDDMFQKMQDYLWDGRNRVVRGHLAEVTEGSKGKNPMITIVPAAKT